MKKKISLLALSSILIAGTSFASGYRIPEQSVDSTAKAGANIASSTGAVTSYYNPANMSWTQDGYQFEADLVYIHLPSVSYEDNRSPLMNGSSKSEHFLFPTFFLVSPDVSDFRFGLSFTAPYGLSKRWEQTFPKSTAEEYSLHVLEMNPTVAYKINHMFSVAGGVRMIYSDAEVRSNAAAYGLYRKMDGDAYDWAYNFAISYTPNDELNVSVTYRSNVDLGLEGDVTMGAGGYTINTGGDVTVPAPAVLGISVAYDFGPVTVDLTWDRTYWSEYESIQFNYDSPALHPVFDQTIIKNWDDSDTYRIGVDYELDQNIMLMAGFAYDETPVPTDTLGFELPDSNAWLYSLGGKYKINEQMEIGMAYLYDYKESRTVVNGSPTAGINGEFTDSAAHLLTVGLSYDF